MFCSACGGSLKPLTKFCPSCGQKVDTSNETSTNNAGSATKKLKTPEPTTQCLTFGQYAAKKSEERSTHFRSSSSKKVSKSKDIDPFALINVGVMKYISPDVATPIRGKNMPLKVKKDATYAEVFSDALVKRQAHDKSFDTTTSWNLVYPDGQHAITLPGESEEDFTLRKYKEDLGKQYNRITLYLCPEEPGEPAACTINQHQRELLECTSENRTKNVKYIQTLLPAVQLPGPVSSGACNSSGVTACYSGDACTISDSDLYYASLVFEELNSDILSSNSDSDNYPGHQEDLEVSEVKKDLSLQEILSELAIVINEEKISKFNISRSHLWEGALRGIRRKTFAPESKVSVKFTDDVGTAEGAVDLGGPKREFFTLIMEWMVNSQLFCGAEKNKFLSCDSNYLTDDLFFYSGELIAMSLVHGGPGPRCFGQPLYDALTKGVMHATVSLDDVYDFELRNSLHNVTNASTVAEAQNLISDRHLETVLDLACTLQVLRTKEDVLKLVDKTAHWFVLGRVHPAYERFKVGLSVLGVLEAMCTHYEKFKEVFCFSSVSLSADTFCSMFSVCYSEEGSNNRAIESLVLSHWNDYLQDVEERLIEISCSAILFFVTGCREVPPCGLALKLCFLHLTEKNGQQSMFPKANSCACELHLPVIHSTYDAFKEDVTFAFLNTKGFGYA